MSDISEIPLSVTIYASIKVLDPRVLELDRGEPVLGKSFENQDSLLEHLAINLVREHRSLSSLDGWADLPDDAVQVLTGHIEADLEREMAS